MHLASGPEARGDAADGDEQRHFRVLLLGFALRRTETAQEFDLLLEGIL